MSAYSARQIARKNGYRSGLEDIVATYLKEHKVKFLYEKIKIEWEDLSSLLTNLQVLFYHNI